MGKESRYPEFLRVFGILEVSNGLCTSPYDLCSSKTLPKQGPLCFAHGSKGTDHRFEGGPRADACASSR
jgi:hypothetical protein